MSVLPSAFACRHRHTFNFHQHAFIFADTLYFGPDTCWKFMSDFCLTMFGVYFKGKWICQTIFAAVPSSEEQCRIFSIHRRHNKRPQSRYCFTGEITAARARSWFCMAGLVLLRPHISTMAKKTMNGQLCIWMPTPQRLVHFAHQDFIFVSLVTTVKGSWPDHDDDSQIGSKLIFA